MASLTLRQTKGAALTHQEVDNNFTSLNTELGTKVQSVSGSTNRITVSGTTAPTIDLASIGSVASATFASITIDAYGRVTALSSGTPYTNADTRAAISGGTGISYSSSTGVIAVDTATIATRSYADTAASTAVSNLVGSAPAALNTLQELATALGNDANFSTTITNSIAAKVSSVTGTSGRITSTGGINPTIDLASGITTPGTYSNATVTVDTYGRVTSISSGTAPVTSVSGTSGRITSSGGATPTIDLASGIVTAGTYVGSVTVDTYGRVTSANNTLSGYNEGTVFNLGTTSTPTINIANGNVQRIILNGNWTFTGFTSAAAGQSVTILITQDATGSRTFATSGITARWANGQFSANKSLSTAANSLDVMYIFFDGSQYLFSLVKGYQ